MGRITIFALDDCHFCHQVKCKFNELGIEYHEINLSQYPQRSKDMVSLTQKRIVPQIFFNTHFMGSVDEVLEWAEQYSSDDIGDRLRLREHLQAHVYSQHEPTDSRLRLPPSQQDAKNNNNDHTNPQLSLLAQSVDQALPPPLPRNEQPSIQVPTSFTLTNPIPMYQQQKEELQETAPPKTNGGQRGTRIASFSRTSSMPGEPSIPTKNNSKSPKKRISIVEMTELLKKHLPIKSRRHNLTTYQNCFTGKEAVETFLQLLFIREEDGSGNKSLEARTLQYGRYLLRKQILFHVVRDHDFANEELFFRLQCHGQPHILNSYRIWNERFDYNIMGTLRRLRKLFVEIELDCLDSKTGHVNLEQVAQHAKFCIFEEGLCEFQSLPLDEIFTDNGTDESSWDNLKMAFGINLYNLCIKYAFVKVGIPENNFQARSQFYSSVKINLGGHLLSFSELEHGMLRSRQKPPSSWGDFLFGDSSERLKGDPEPITEEAMTKLATKRVDPRIHFSLNCGAKSCPPIKEFTVHNLQQELVLVTEAFCELDENVEIQPKAHVLRLSQLFNWYQGDFTKGGDNNDKTTVPEFLLQYLHGEKKEQLQTMMETASANNRPIMIRYNSYDWSPVASNYIKFHPNNLRPNQSFKLF